MMMMDCSTQDMPSPDLEQAFRVTLVFGATADVGRLATGGTRTVRPVTGGRIDGARLRGMIVSGSETSLTRLDGVTTAELSYLIQTEDGAIVRMAGMGVTSDCRGTDDQSFDGMRMTIMFEVDEQSSHAWLATRAFIAERPRDSDTSIIMQMV